MPNTPDPTPIRAPSLQSIADGTDTYPIEAFQFVQVGLSLTVQRLHGKGDGPEADRHITGQQLCHGLRDLALERWGLLAGTVLQRWNITSTLDFGHIVFALVDNGILSKTEQDTLDDFRDVFCFRGAFEQGYRIECKS